jgi:hypothetical protein
MDQGETEKICTGTGHYDLTAEMKRVGEDLLIAVYGGERPHIGAVAVAEALPSLKDPDRKSASASVICCTGHKEDLLAREAALELAGVAECTVVVTVGMHWENLSKEKIALVEVKMAGLIRKMRETLVET